MFEKIGRYAEKLATSPGLTRRGFFALTGKGALTLATLVGGLLLFQGKTVASKCTGGCRYHCPDGSFVVGECTVTCGCEGTKQHGGMTCGLIKITCRPA